jgi:hypothetical protein
MLSFFPLCCSRSARNLACGAPQAAIPSTRSIVRLSGGDPLLSFASSGSPPRPWTYLLVRLMDSRFRFDDFNDFRQGCLKIARIH